MPIIAAATLTGLFLDGNLLASLRLVGDYARSPLEETVLRCVPSLEWWPVRWISARAAMDVAGVWSGSASGHGLGWMAGLGIVLGDLELDLNYIERFRPYRLFPGLGNPNDRSVLVGVTWEGLGQRR